MKKLLTLTLLLLVVAACEKRSAKHCPLMEETKTGHTTDLTPITAIPQVMDTLRKYPQLQAFHYNVVRGLNDPEKISGSATCNVFYKGLLVFDKMYSVSYMDYDGSVYEGGFLPKFFKAIQAGTEPALSLENANAIAIKALPYEHCTVSRLGLLNKGTDSIPDYKLVWRVRDAETGYPLVDVDALNGTVLNKIDAEQARH